MNLTLKVISHHNELLGDGATMTFDEQGGSFGRSADNAWVIPDDNRVVSGQHGMIFFEDGHFHLMDISKNGIYLNDSSSPLGKGQVTVLQVGDTMSFGDYQVQVCADNDNDTSSVAPDGNGAMSSVVASDPGTNEEPAGLEVPESAPQSDYQQHELEEHREPAYDPLAGIGSGSAQSNPGPLDQQHFASSPNSGLVHDGSSPQNAAFTSGAVKADIELKPSTGSESGRELIPEDWDQIDFDESDDSAGNPVESLDDPPEYPIADTTAPRIAAAVAPAAEPAIAPGSSSGLDAYQAFMRGVGLGTANGSNSLRDMEKAGVLFRELVQGLMLLLQSRAELKNQFRMSATTIKPTENNPLKFSPHVDEALKTLFADDRQGFLAGDEAIKEAIGDISNHQIAMIVAMHAGIGGLLDKFQPRRFEKEEGGGLVSSALLAANKKSRAWENYRNYYERVVVESGDAFQILCAEEFNDAYDEQLRILESGKSGK